MYQQQFSELCHSTVSCDSHQGHGGNGLIVGLNDLISFFFFSLSDSMIMMATS